jgi:hypothetical protein
MEFIEAKQFTQAALEHLNEAEYLELQMDLIKNPKKGVLIKGGGGIRKLRFGAQGRGKSGGVRVIYYWRSRAGQIHMLALYPKSIKLNLTDNEVSALARLVKGIEYGQENL